MPDYTRAEDVEQIAAELIRLHHPHLDRVRIEYVWRDKASVKGGKIVLGKARKVSGLNAYLSRPDPDSDVYVDYFVIEIAADTWAALNEDQQRALVDHELMHCGLDANFRLTLVPHDCEAFVNEIVRHGLWKRDLAELVEAGKGVQRLALVAEA